MVSLSTNTHDGSACDVLLFLLIIVWNESFRASSAILRLGVVQPLKPKLLRVLVAVAVIVILATPMVEANGAGCLLITLFGSVLTSALKELIAETQHAVFAISLIWGVSLLVLLLSADASRYMAAIYLAVASYNEVIPVV